MGCSTIRPARITKTSAKRRRNSCRSAVRPGRARRAGPVSAGEDALGHHHLLGFKPRGRARARASRNARPEFKLVLVTNHRPKVDGDDDAIWRRLRLIPFEQSFEGREDRTLAEKLEAELPGILA